MRRRRNHAVLRILIRSTRTMHERSRWAFWGVALGVLALICVPSTYFVEALGRYQRYLADVDPTAVRPIRMRFVPHRDGRADVAPRLDFVEFSIRRPKAK